MVKTIHTQMKQDLAQVKNPNILYHRLTFSETISGWIRYIKSQVEELRGLGCTYMAKPEYQALLLMNSLPNTSLWQDFKADHPIQALLQINYSIAMDFVVGLCNIQLILD